MITIKEDESLKALLQEKINLYTQRLVVASIPIQNATIGIAITKVDSYMLENILWGWYTNTKFC